MLKRKTDPMMAMANSALIDLPSPSNISYFWNFGSLMGMCLLTQITTGLFLAMHYSSDANSAFNSISHITRDVNNGWLLRAIHSNGASFFFIMVYAHIGRGVYYSSFHKLMPWLSGLIILFILMATAFLGYVLPWGQMSFWGATVITNLLSAAPYVGESLTPWVWGGFSVDSATLTRFYALHYLAPLLMSMLILAHIMFLHNTGSSNPLGTPLNIDKIPFHPYFIWKDIYGLLVFMPSLVTLALMAPYFLSDPDNFTVANPLVTPPHIQPEWYFLFAYAILRSVPSKLGGVLALLSSIIILTTLPLSMKNKFNPTYCYPSNKILFWLFTNSFMLLTYLGACPMENPYTTASQIMALLYFSFYLILPLTTK